MNQKSMQNFLLFLQLRFPHYSQTFLLPHHFSPVLHSPLSLSTNVGLRSFNCPFEHGFLLLEKCYAKLHKWLFQYYRELVH